MVLNEYLQILRRRWVVVLAGVLVGFVAGYVTAPGEGTQAPDYQATTTLIANPSVVTNSSGGSLVNLSQAALLVTRGAVPRRAAKMLGISDPETATENLTAAADTDVGSVTI